MRPVPHRAFVFDTTNAALWAEELARDAGIPAEVIPAPEDARAKCDLALITLWEHAAELARVLEDAGVTYRRWPLRADDGPQ